MHALKPALRRLFVVAAAVAVPVVVGAAPASAASWRIVASPNSTANDGLAAVTSFSPSSVWAAGQAYAASGGTSSTLIEQYNGSSWQVVPSPNAAGGRQNSLSGIAGTSASDIWAVGYDLSSRSHTHPLTEHYNGSAWSVVPAPQVAQMDGLAGVASVSSTSVWAVGGGNTGTGNTPPLVEHYNGTAWSVVPTSLTTQGWLNSVTAISAANVWAVGHVPGAGLVMHYDGTSWTQVAVPAPTGSTGWELTAVTATSASDVWAVGDATIGSVQHAIVEHFNGTSWSVTVAPDAAGSAYNEFFGVAAVSATNVWAVGSSSPGNATSTPLIEHFDGVSWTVQPAPTTGGSNVSFGGVTSTSAGQLWAVGQSFPAGSTNSQTLIAQYS